MLLIAVGGVFWLQSLPDGISPKCKCSFSIASFVRRSRWQLSPVLRMRRGAMAVTMRSEIL